MAQDIKIAGATYPTVPAVDLATPSGGIQRFVDSSDADATAEDILQGKTAYSNGVKLTGTARAGASSWNDLTDRPFYEETIPGIDLQQPDYTTADGVSFDVDYANTATLPAKAVRISDYYTPTQLSGAVCTMLLGDESDDRVVDDYLVTADHWYGMFHDGVPWFFVTDTDDVTVSMSGSGGITFSVALPTAGIYFLYVDANTIQEGMSLHTVSIEKDAQTIVHKLDNRFLDNGNILIEATCTGTQLQSGSFQLSLPSGTAAAALSQSDYNKRNVLLQLTASDLNLVALVPIQVARTVEDSSGNVMPQSAVGSTTFFSDFTGTMQQWNINATVAMTDTVTVVLTPMAKGPFLVTATLSLPAGSDTLTGTADKTYAQISAAVATGQEVKARLNFSTDTDIELQLAVIPKTNSDLFVFIGPLTVHGGIAAVEMRIDSSNNVTGYFETYSSLTSASGVSF